MENRSCKDCSLSFPLTEAFFYKTQNKGGMDIRCKQCRKIYIRKWELVNRNKLPKNLDVPKGFKKCTICTQILPKTQEYFKLEQGKYFWGACNPCRNFSRRERDKAYYEKTRDKQLEARKAWRNANRATQKEWFKGNYNTPWGKFRHIRNGAKARDIGFELSFEEFKDFWQSPCYFCDSDISTIGLDRLNSSLGYVTGNIVPCCSKCNFAKHLMSVEEFVDHCEKVVLNFKKARKLVAV